MPLRSIEPAFTRSFAWIFTPFQPTEADQPKSPIGLSSKMGGYPARWVNQGQTVGSCKQLHVHLQALDWRMVDVGWHPDPSWQPTPVHIKVTAPGGTPYIQMIGMTVVLLRGWNLRFGIF